MESSLPERLILARYFYHMARLLRLDKTVFREIFEGRAALGYAVINVLVFGLFYGMAAVYMSRHLLAPGQPPGTVPFNPLAVVMVGVSVAFLMHGGAALFIWVFCRGLGGRVSFMPPYLSLGIAAIALWPLAPALSGLQAGLAGPGLQAWAVAAGLYGAAVVFLAIEEVSGLSRIKMILAAAATVGYVGCFLYLWL